MHLLFSILAQLSSTINVFTSMLLGLLYCQPSMVLATAAYKLLDLLLSVVTQDRPATIRTNVYWGGEALL